MGEFRRFQVPELLKRMREEPERIIFVTGPRQTGKTTTVLQALNQVELPNRYASADPDDSVAFLLTPRIADDEITPSSGRVQTGWAKPCARARSSPAAAVNVIPTAPATCGPRSAHNDSMHSRFTLEAYSRIIKDEPDDADRYRALMHQLPRRFHELRRDEQAAVLLERPPLTGSRWDVLLAAVVEHIARLHQHAIPAWVDEPERFLEDPWVIARSRVIAEESVLYAPGAFIRHSVFPDPLDLDARGGETHVWVP